jgi:hypothetical protein
MEADLSRTDLSGANLMGAVLAEANLSRAALSAANISNTILYKTQLGDLDLCDTKGMDNVRHLGPSLISSSTLELSKGTIPELFLRGCGLSDWEIESAKLHQPGLSTKKGDAILYRLHALRFGQAMQSIPLFISYSHKDEAFVDEMEKHLNDKGIRFWRDIHDTPAGPLEKIVERAMRLNPTVLLVLSTQSVGSEWVELEAESAKEIEKELGRYVLYPITLDEAWKDYEWEQRLRRQINKYSILNFSKWKDKGEFTELFGRLIDELDLFYKEG